MTEWEYLVERIHSASDRATQEYLSEHGAHGWELVSLVHEESTRVAYFKRPKDKE